MSDHSMQHKVEQDWWLHLFRNRIVGLQAIKILLRVVRLVAPLELLLHAVWQQRLGKCRMRVRTDMLSCHHLELDQFDHGAVALDLRQSLASITFVCHATTTSYLHVDSTRDVVIDNRFIS